MRVAAAVLAGGASRRMGEDKALVEIDGEKMADRVLHAARAAGADPVFLLGGDPATLSVLSAPVVADRYPGDGPVGGLLGALERVDDLPDGATHLLLLACDLAMLDAATLRTLIDEAAGDAHSQVWVAATDRLEPMCSLWSLDTLGEVRDAFVSGERALHRVIGGFRHVAVTVSGDALRNINTPDDLPG